MIASHLLAYLFTELHHDQAQRVRRAARGHRPGAPPLLPASAADASRLPPGVGRRETRRPTRLGWRGKVGAGGGGSGGARGAFRRAGRRTKARRAPSEGSEALQVPGLLFRAPCERRGRAGRRRSERLVRPSGRSPASRSPKEAAGTNCPRKPPESPLRLRALRSQRVPPAPRPRGRWPSRPSRDEPAGPEGRRAGGPGAAGILEGPRDPPRLPCRPGERVAGRAPAARVRLAPLQRGARERRARRSSGTFAGFQPALQRGPQGSGGGGA